MNVLRRKGRKTIAIIGCGAQSRYILDTLSALQIKCRIFLIDPLGKGPKEVHGIPVSRISPVKNIRKFLRKKNIKIVFTAISANAEKARILEYLRKDFCFPPLIHPQTVISSSAKLEDACVINPFVYIGPNALIKRGTFIHSFVNIDHDCEIGECANLAPGVILAGRVKIGKCAYIYTSASIIPDIRVGDFSIIGAGSNVLRNVSPGRTVVGNPAIPLKNAKQ